MSLNNLANWAMPPEEDTGKKSGCDCGGKKKPGSCASSCGCKEKGNSETGKSGSCSANAPCGAAKKDGKAGKKGPCSPGSCSPGSCAGAPGKGDKKVTEKKD